MKAGHKRSRVQELRRKRFLTLLIWTPIVNSTLCCLGGATDGAVAANGPKTQSHWTLRTPSFCDAPGCLGHGLKTNDSGFVGLEITFVEAVRSKLPVNQGKCTPFAFWIQLEQAIDTFAGRKYGCHSD